MKYYILIFLFNFNFIMGINIIREGIPKEIQHGVLYCELLSSNKDYKYYINITEYELNEENIFELYSEENKIIRLMSIYILLTNATIEEILNYGIEPTSENQYIITENSYKTDYSTGQNFFFMPFKKISTDKKYFLIKIIIDEGIINKNVNFSISYRIPTFHLNFTGNNTILFSGSLKCMDNIHLYYKFELDKNINLKKKNILFFVNDSTIPIFSTNLTSLITFVNNLFIIQKNKSIISEVYLGLKDLHFKNISITINLDKNDFLLINGEKKISQKFYLEQINCRNKFYIIENNNVLYNKEMKKFLILNKLYGNYSLKYYNSCNNINFEEYSFEEGIEIKEKIESIEGNLNIFILNCTTPTAFIFELFSEDSSTKIILEEGKQIKHFLSPRKENFNIELNIKEDYKKYKFFISLLDKDNRNKTQDIICYFDYNGKTEQFILENNNKAHNETIYYIDKQITNISINANDGIFIYYFLSSNRLFHNIIEGESIVDKKEMQNLIFKIRKDLLFDYFTFEADSNKNINANYELKILNSEYIENNNKIIVPIPDINIPESKSIKLKFSNPYNKFDSLIVDNNDENYYLLINFENVDINFPIYVNIKYNYNEKILPISQKKSELILVESEYEIYGNKSYFNETKILFNIIKCDCSNNYSFIHYYENDNNIINVNNITKKREFILEKNIYYNSKIKIIRDNNNDNKFLKSFIPADYYNNGDLVLNYFIVSEKSYNQYIITKDFSINYKDKMRSKIYLNWKEYITKNNNHINTNYSIYILPKNSIINSMCQFLMIPSNISVINSTEIEIKIDKGNYKVAIIATVIDKDFPFTSIYDILYLNVNKRLNIILIIVLSSIGFLIIFLILFILFRKKRKFICFKRDENTFSSKIEDKEKTNNRNLSGIENDIINESSLKRLKEEEMNSLNDNLIKN